MPCRLQKNSLKKASCHNDEASLFHESQDIIAVNAFENIRRQSDAMKRPMVCIGIIIEMFVFRFQNPPLKPVHIGFRRIVGAKEYSVCIFLIKYLQWYNRKTAPFPLHSWD